MVNNTINNVPRELLERLAERDQFPHKTKDALTDLRAFLSAPSPAGVTPHEENHHQKALALYSLILSNVEELAQSIVKGKRPDEKYIDSARIGVMQAHIERLCAMLPDWQIEAMLERMQSFQEKTLDKK